MRQILSALPRLRLVLLSALIVPALLAAENREVRIAAPAAWVEPVSLPTATTSPEASIGRHYLVVDAQTNVTEKATYRHNAYRILNEDGLRYGSQISLSFDPAYETLTLHHVRLVRGADVLDRLDRAKIQVLQREDDLEYLLYNGQLSAHLILDDVRVGDIVDYAYTTAGTNPVFGDHYIDGFTVDWGVPVALLKQRVVHPREHRIAHRAFGDSRIEMRESNTAHGRELVWEARDLQARTYDRRIPSWYDTNSFVQLTDFPSWAAVVEWALPLYAPPEAAADALREKAAALAAGATTPEERALLALRFVQEEIRYLGIETGPGSHRPSPPADVLARRFGDCKDKAHLFVSLLRLMDVEAFPVLVHSWRRHTLAGWLPSPFAFNHVIAVVHIGDARYVVDPTLVYQRGDLRQRHTARYHGGLVVAPGTTGLSVWPASPNDLARTFVQENFTVPGFDAPATLHVRSTYTARSAERMRGQLTGTNRDDLGKSYLDFYARYFPEISATKPVSWHDNADANTIVVDEYYSIPNLFVREPEGSLLKATFHPTTIYEYAESPGAAGRKTPLAIAHPVDITSRTRISLHEPWSIKSETTEIDDSAFTFSREIASSGAGKEVEFTYRWRSKADHVSRENFVGHSRNVARVTDTLGYELTYNTAASGEAPYVFNWSMLALAGVVTAASGFGAHRLWRIRQPPTPPPLPGADWRDHQLTGLGGWLILVGFGVVVRPILMLVTLGTSTSTYFNLETWRLLTSPDSPAYQPSYIIIAPVELILNLVLFIGSILMIGLFFGRRKLFPRVICAILALELLVAIFGAWATGSFSTSTAQERSEAYRMVARTIVAAVIWIPYFNVSRRVKQTFTE